LQRIYVLETRTGTGTLTGMWTRTLTGMWTWTWTGIRTRTGKRTGTGSGARAGTGTRPISIRNTIDKNAPLWKVYTGPVYSIFLKHATNYDRSYEKIQKIRKILQRVYDTN
jgi:hypothetical protein